MSRGLGRLQRDILDVLAQVEVPPYNLAVPASGRTLGQANDELTTHHVCSALADRGRGWDDTFERQVRRALDRLHDLGHVDKRLVPNEPYHLKAQRALWRGVRRG